MSERPWLTIIGLGENGPDGLTPASAKALEAAEVIIGPPRHLALIGQTQAQQVAWPVPFADGLELLLSHRGRPVVALASGDPFWFGAGRVIAEALTPGEWQAHPGPSCFSLAAAHLGWGLEQTQCLGLHAAPLTRLRPHLAPGAQIICTLRDGDGPSALCAYLDDLGFGASKVVVLEALGGPKERLTEVTASDGLQGHVAHPVCAAIRVAGTGAALPRASGKPDATFQNDGQITKRPIRALTLSALAPKPRELLWDIGGGSGSIAIEWMLSDPTCRAISIEPRADRAVRISENAEALGVDQLCVITGAAPAALEGLAQPEAVFIGGGLSDDLMRWLTQALAPGTRLVANAVTLESEATLTRWQARLGGDLLRIELSQAQALGPRLGWKSAFPVVQWSVVL